MSPKSHLTIGSRAPLFRLKQQTGQTIALRDWRGKKAVVLVFYPGDLTPGCTMQLCAIRDDWSKFRSADALVFGVNHADAESHTKFVRKHGFPFPLLIDRGKKVSQRYGATRTFFKTKIIRRTVVVIGYDGKITFYRHGMPKNSDILKAIAAANAKS